ncbi:MAG: hypothetical protein J6R22_02960 [Alphaproteobacteria bacterium]|nr:hypothetical protein [Alphaproteobacteria bacterium]
MAKDDKKLQSFASFNSGEYSPSLAGRVDLESFGSAVRFSSNFISEETGGIKKFYGSNHIKELENTGQVLLIPFYNSYEPMCLVFTTNFVGVILTDTYSSLEIRPLTCSDLRKVRWKQINDQIILVADDIPIQVLNFLGPDTESGAYKFESSIYTLDYEPFFPIGWSGNYNGEIETIGANGVITVKIPEDETSIKIELPVVLKNATQVNMLGANNYMSTAKMPIVLGQTTATLYKKSADGTETELASAIVSSNPTAPHGGTVTNSNIIDG